MALLMPRTGRGCAIHRTHVRIDPTTSTQSESFSRMNADPAVGRYIRGRPETKDETVTFLSRIKEHWSQWGYGLWAAEHKHDRQFIGFVGFSHHRLFPNGVEVGWRLDPRYWGEGLATEGARAALRLGYDEFKFDQLISIIHRDNVASRRVAEKLAMSLWQESEFEHPESGEAIPTVVYRQAMGRERLRGSVVD